MLERLLKRISTGGIHSQAQLSRELGVSETLLEQMLADLQRMGYLRPMDVTCDSHCDHCASSPTCAIHGSGRVWEMTDKKLPF
jgi:hypothetical protein